MEKKMKNVYFESLHNYRYTLIISYLNNTVQEKKRKENN